MKSMPFTPRRANASVTARGERRGALEQLGLALEQRLGAAGEQTAAVPEPAGAERALADQLPCEPEQDHVATVGGEHHRPGTPAIRSCR